MSNETTFYWSNVHIASNNHQINCAGVEGVRPLLDVDMEWAKQVYDVNVWGPLAVTQAFAPLVIKSKGIIANLSSIGCKIPMCWAGTLPKTFLHS
jgi:short-subunit dehydrogenase